MHLTFELVDKVARRGKAYVKRYIRYAFVRRSQHSLRFRYPHIIHIFREAFFHYAFKKS